MYQKPPSYKAQKVFQSGVKPIKVLALHIKRAHTGNTASH